MAHASRRASRELLRYFHADVGYVLVVFGEADKERFRQFYSLVGYESPGQFGDLGTRVYGDEFPDCFCGCA